MPFDARNDADLFRTPTDLSVTSNNPLKILFVGSCLAAGLLPFYKWSHDIDGDYVLFNNIANLPDAPPRPTSFYDLSIVQIPLRSVWPDQSIRLRYDDIEGYSRLFTESEQRLLQLLDAAMRWNIASGMPTLVINFLQPQQNSLGRLMPWHDLRNSAYFVMKLNETLASAVSEYKNSYILDFYSISATYGRKYVQDDLLWQTNHGAALGDNDFTLDQNRLHPPAPVSSQYTLLVQEFLRAVFAEIQSSYRVIRQADAVKLVIIDLDDTLWRGVIAESGVITHEATEGWPFGFAEALLTLKRRGIVLGIASKNDENRVRSLWNQIWGGVITLEDFAIVRINWKPKHENILEIISDVNVLSGSVVFIDDNPVERAIVEESLPGIRTLGSDLYSIRRILLWSSETQVPSISSESAKRTEMIRAQVDREGARKLMPRAEFIASLNVQIDFIDIASIDHPRFARAFELINKTNQFNTNGERWTIESAKAAFETGTVFCAFEVKDKYTEYGLVGVAIYAGSKIQQFVMSCRVIGLDVETRALQHVTQQMKRNGAGEITAVYTPTEKNDLCATLYQSAGFSGAGENLWRLP